MATDSTTSRHADRHLILYDGVCALCNRFNAFVLRRDPVGRFHFAPIQSDVGRRTLQQFRRDPDALDTFYVLADYHSSSPRLWSRARAALFVAREVGGVWRLAAIFGVLPDFPLNTAYDLIARNRYRIFGRYETCLVPRPEYKDRFVGL
jgi:predicted DCC family thiol-disulfide oxidoreductase YuxK